MSTFSVRLVQSKGESLEPYRTRTTFHHLIRTTLLSLALTVSKDRERSSLWQVLGEAITNTAPQERRHLKKSKLKRWLGPSSRSGRWKRRNY